jgi:hypothetical protein
MDIIRCHLNTLGEFSWSALPSSEDKLHGQLELSNAHCFLLMCFTNMFCKWSNC